MSTKYFTLGEVARQGLLKKLDGSPITDQSHVSRIARVIGTEKIMTKFGPSKCLHIADIDKYNSKKINPHLEHTIPVDNP